MQLTPHAWKFFNGTLFNYKLVSAADDSDAAQLVLPLPTNQCGFHLRHDSGDVVRHVYLQYTLIQFNYKRLSDNLL